MAGLKGAAPVQAPGLPTDEYHCHYHDAAAVGLGSDSKGFSPSRKIGPTGGNSGAGAGGTGLTHGDHTKIFTTCSISLERLATLGPGIYHRGS